MFLIIKLLQKKMHKRTLNLGKFVTITAMALFCTASLSAQTPSDSSQSIKQPREIITEAPPTIEEYVLPDEQARGLTGMDVDSLTFPIEDWELQSLRNLDLSNRHHLSLKSLCIALHNVHKEIILTSYGEVRNYDPTILRINISDKIKSLPHEIGKVKNLTKLILDDNPLTLLPPEIGELQNLTELSLEDNQLTALPPEIGELQNLIELNVRFNSELTTLPSEIGKLKNLTALRIRFCNLTTLPPEIGELQNLAVLCFGGNPLTVIPSTFKKLKNLIYLDLGCNRSLDLKNLFTTFQDYPKKIILSNRTITTDTALNITISPVESLPPEIEKLQNLIEIHLDGNRRLIVLPPEIGKLKNLTKFSIYNSQLSILPLEIVELKNLTYLNLENNKLDTLPPEIGQLKNLDTLILRGNPIPEVEHTKIRRLLPGCDIRF